MDASPPAEEEEMAGGLGVDDVLRSEVPGEETELDS